MAGPAFLPLALAALAAQSPPGAGTPDSAFSPFYAPCIEASGGVTAAMRACAADEAARLDHALNQAYQAALARQPGPAGRTALRRSQRAWLRTRYGHCAALAEPERGGTLWLLIMDQCGLDAVAARVLWLRRYTG